MSRATYDSGFAIVFLRKKKRYTFLKAFYITEILALAIVRTLDIQLSVETTICTAKYGCNPSACGSRLVRATVAADTRLEYWKGQDFQKKNVGQK